MMIRRQSFKARIPPTSYKSKANTMINHNKIQKFEYSKITTYIYIGTNVCCRGHFDKELIKKGIRADLSLEEIRLDQPFGVDYYLWLPTKDHTISKFKQLLVGVTFLKELEKQKVKCYIHCQNGHGRAPSFVAAYLISKGMDVHEALTFIKNKRPTIHPNKKQINGLINFKRKWSKK